MSRANELATLNAAIKRGERKKATEMEKWTPNLEAELKRLYDRRDVLNAELARESGNTAPAEPTLQPVGDGENQALDGIQEDDPAADDEALALPSATVTAKAKPAAAAPRRTAPAATKAIAKTAAPRRQEGEIVATAGISDPNTAAIAAKMNSAAALLTAQLPQGTISSRQFLNGALAAISQSEALAKTIGTPTGKVSFIKAIHDASALGLPISGRSGVHLIPYGAAVNLQLGYESFLELARRAGVTVFSPEVIYKGERWEQRNEVRNGAVSKVFSHQPSTEIREEAKDDDIVAAYVMWQNRSGLGDYRLVDRSEIDKARKHSKRSGGPWGTHYGAMAMKTAILRAAKSWPVTPELSAAVALGEAEFDFVDGGTAVSVDDSAAGSHSGGGGEARGVRRIKGSL